MVESARHSFYEEYKEKGNSIMLRFKTFKTVNEIIAQGQEAIFYYEQAY